MCKGAVMSFRFVSSKGSLLAANGMAGENSVIGCHASSHHAVYLIHAGPFPPPSCPSDAKFASVLLG